MTDETTVPPRGAMMPGDLIDFAAVHMQGVQGRVVKAIFRPRGGGAEVPVAVKTLHNHNDTEALRRLQNEGQCLQCIASPHVPRYVWDGLYGGRWILVMEWKRGVTLGEWLATHPQRPVPRVREVALGLCRAVAAAHSCSPPMTHRDLGPKNILIDDLPDEDCAVCVIDFGLARRGSGLGTSLGVPLGNERYMSPEQRAGASAHATPASDVFSIAALIVDLLRNDGLSDCRAERIRARGVSDFLGAPPLEFEHVWEVLAKALALQSTQRYPDAARLGEELALAWPSAVGGGFGAGEPSSLAQGIRKDALGIAERLYEKKDLARAAEWFRRAATEALGRDELDVALRHVARGVSCNPSGEVLGSLLLCSAEAFRWKSRFADAANAAADALKHVPEGSALWYRAVEELAVDCHRVGVPKAIATELHRLASVLERHRPGPDLIDEWTTAIAQVANHFYYLGRWEEASVYLARIEGMVPNLDGAHPIVRARVYQVQAFDAFYKNRVDDHIQYLEMAQKAFEQAGQARNACMQQARVGQACFDFGRYERAEVELRASLERAQAEGWWRVMPAAHRGLGQLRAYLGRFEEAERHARDALDGFRAQEYAPMEAVARGELAAVLLAAGKPQLAATEASIAVDMKGATVRSRAHARAVLSQAQRILGDPSAAWETIRRVLENADDLGDAGWVEQTARLAAAEALDALGRRDEAVREIKAARDILQKTLDRCVRPEDREILAHNVPENARILTYVREWLGVEGG